MSEPLVPARGKIFEGGSISDGEDDVDLVVFDDGPEDTDDEDDEEK